MVGKNKEFIDSAGIVGTTHAIGKGLSFDVRSRDLPNKKTIRFTPCDHESIFVALPNGYPKTIKVTKKNAIRLAHWLLDHCTDPST